MPGRHDEIDIMNTDLSLKIELMEGRLFILGREGHIYVDSPTASKHHAVERPGGHWNTNHRQGGVSGQNTGKVGGSTGSADDDLRAVGFCVG